MQYNPFIRLKEVSSLFITRFLRTTFRQKCVDTFVVLLGTQTDGFDVETLGLIDYLTLGLFLYIHQTFQESFKHYKQSPQAFIFFVFCFVLNLAGWVFKTAASLALSLLCLPIVGLCHGLSLLFGGKQLKSRSMQLLGLDKSSQEASVEPLSLQAFLRRHNRAIDELNAELKVTQKPVVTHLIDKTKSVSEHVFGLFSRAKAQENRGDADKENKRCLQMTYVYQEEKPWFSNATFVYLSIMISTLLPCLAVYSAPQLTQSAADRLSQAVNGLPKDVFEVEIDPTDGEQQLQLSALLQLNIANTLQMLMPKEGDNEVLATEKVRLQLL